MKNTHKQARPFVNPWLGVPVLTALLSAPMLLMAQQNEGESRYQRFAPIDLTGNWVSVITEDWHVRMIAPPRGNFESLPVTDAAIAAANNADLERIEADGQACQAFAAPSIMREPGRVRISWEDGDTLRIDTDAGEQTRLLHFGEAPEAGAPSWQGHSIAQWEYYGDFNPDRELLGGFGGRAGRGGPPATEPEGGKLRVETSNLQAGLLRKNGMPFSADTQMTEYYNIINEPDGTQWFIVTTRIHDPRNLLVDYITSSNFMREPDGSGWNPTPCSLR